MRKNIQNLTHRLQWLMAVFLLPASANAATLINCYDETREMVTQTSLDQCQGRAINDNEANAIRERRQAYIQNSLKADDNPMIIGKRLMSVGAGFFVNMTGAVLTNAHVINNCDTLIVSRAGGEMVTARPIATELGIDLALINVDCRPDTTAIFAPADAPLPNTVTIVGYPNQGLPPLRPLRTSGTILPSKLESTATVARPLSIQADVRPGNSGGPVLDEQGRVIGIVFAAVDTPAVYKHTGRIVRDVGVAIPNHLTFNFLERNAITPTILSTAEIATQNTVDDASLFMARVECWR